MTGQGSTEFNLEMPRVGVIRGVLAKDIEIVGEKVVNLRVCARPYRNTYSAAQLRNISRVARKYGSGKVHLSPRHNLEIPEVKQARLQDALKELYISGLFPGGAGTSVRNIFTCPEWCTRSIRPVQELGTMVSKNFGDMEMPNKITISFAGCINKCPRPEHCDIGVLAMQEVLINNKVSCVDMCEECIKACKFDAIARDGRSVTIDTQRCQYCVRCVEACTHGVLMKGRSGFRLFAGGKEGSTVMHGVECAEWLEDFEVLERIDHILRIYRERAGYRKGSTKKMERLGEIIQREGITPFSK